VQTKLASAVLCVVNTGLTNNYILNSISIGPRSPYLFYEYFNTHNTK